MAGEARIRFPVTGLTTVYVTVVRCADGFYYNGSTFVDLTTLGWPTFARPASEKSSTRWYYADMPAVPAGGYDLVFYLQAGAQPDVIDDYLGQSFIDWKGTDEVFIGDGGAADRFLLRNIKGGYDGGRIVAEAFAASRNKVTFNVPGPGYFTVYDTDDVTPLWTGTFTRDPGMVGGLTNIDPG